MEVMGHMKQRKQGCNEARLCINVMPDEGVGLYSLNMRHGQWIGMASGRRGKNIAV